MKRTPLASQSIKRLQAIAAGTYKPKKPKGFKKPSREKVLEKRRAAVQKMVARGLVKRAVDVTQPPKEKKPKIKSILAALDEELVELHGQVVRLRARNEDGFVVCFICGAIVPYDESENMHFQARGGRGIRFHDVGCQAGCHWCNAKPLGDRKNFARRLDEEFGPGTAEELTILSKQVMHYDREWYEDRIEEMKHLKKALLTQ